MEIKEPQIPKETYEAMKEFFMKTSVPRILAKRKEVNQNDIRKND